MHLIEIIAPTLRKAHPIYDTPAFKRWFAGSKVVDANGQPLLCYHGTFESFDVFRLESERRRAYGFNRLGFWFDTDHMTPNYFATGYDEDNVTRTGDFRSIVGNVMPVYLSIKHPLMFISEPVWQGDQPTLDTHAKARNWAGFNAAVAKLDRSDAFDHLQHMVGGEDLKKSSRAYEERVDAFRAEAIGEGYDGIYLEDTLADAGTRGGKPTNWWIAFRPEQIKSAISNSGAFSAENPSIGESR